MERYTPGETAWEDLPSTILAHDNAATTISSDGTLYAMGGVESQGIDFAEKLLVDVSTAWVPIPRMLTARYEFAAGYDLIGRVFVFGGCDAQLFCGETPNTGEAYTP